MAPHWGHFHFAKCASLYATKAPNPVWTSARKKFVQSRACRFRAEMECAGTDARGGNVQRPRGCPAQLLAEPIAVSAQCTPHDSKKGEAAVGSRAPESVRRDP